MLYTILIASLLIVAANAQFPVPDPPKKCGGKWNLQQIYLQEPRYLRSVKNAKLYTLDSVDPPIRIAHLWGSHFEMGYALGQLMRDELRTFAPSVMEYFYNVTATWLVQNEHLSGPYARLLAREAVNFGLEMTYELTKPFTPARFDEEIRGLALATGVDAHLITLINQIPELTKAGCTMMGVWGPAVRKMNRRDKNIKRFRSDGGLIQLRALDWNTDGPFNDYPTVLVYHPDPVKVPGAHDFLSFSYPGFVGAISGYSSTSLAISEIGTQPDIWNGTDSRAGYPFHYVLRDILEFDVDSTAALNRIYAAKRTCAIWIGLGDSYTNQFRAVAYGHDYAEVYSDRNFPLTFSNVPDRDVHPRFPGVVYEDSHHGPPEDYCFSQLIREAYGSIDVPAIINMTAADNTGTTHVAVYDFSTEFVYLAHASSATKQPVIMAADRPFCRVDARRLFQEAMPTRY